MVAFEEVVVVGLEGVEGGSEDGEVLLELLGLDPSAEAEPGGLRTRWASGSLGLAGSGLHLRHC